MVKLSRMKLTSAERLILYNQFRILQHVVDDIEARDCEQACEILQSGYTLEYPSLIQMNEELPEELACEVKNILDMHRALRNSVQGSSETTTDVSFKGFDGNEEGAHHNYALFLIETQGRWTESKIPDLNSHWPLLPRYRAMLAVWQGVADKWKLTAEDLRRILDAGRTA